MTTNPRQSAALARSIVTSAGIVALFAGIAEAQPAPPAPPAAQPPPIPGAVQATATQLSGSVIGYNFGPRGNYEGLMLKSADKLIQVNFPPDAGGSIAAAAQVGDQISLSATPAIGMPDHGVYELVSLTPARGQPLTIAGPDAWRVQHVDGTIKSVNFGRRGEVDGVVLDNGDFVHFGPEEANLVNMAVGQKIAVDGYSRPMLIGHDVIEADSINGTRVRKAAPPPPDRRGPGPADAPPRPPGPNDAPPPPPRP